LSNLREFIGSRVAVTTDRRWNALDGMVLDGKTLRVELIR
jgi:hypothetical protein